MKNDTKSGGGFGALGSLSDWLIVVPARLASTRLPNKPLADLGGRPMIVRVAENLRPLTERGAALIVATDAPQVRQVVEAAGLRAAMTRVEHPSGTDRCWEVAQGTTHPFILNVQGDEPFAAVDDLLALTRAFSANAAADMATLAFRSTDSDAAGDPNVVKVIRSAAEMALYFSRAAIPYRRDGQEHRPDAFWRHLGVYAFRRDRLRAFVAMPPSPLEEIEKLEQLRALEHGWLILVTEAKNLSHGIDTPADLEAARARFK